jgi:predicted amidohydrolase
MSSYYKEYYECPEPYYKRPLPNYEVVPLRRNNISVAAIQMNIKVIDTRNPRKGIRENLDRLLNLVDAAFEWPPGQKDLLCTPEFCLHGHDYRWTRKDSLNIAIELPGEETELIGKKAKEHNCYIEVACYTRETDWPNHYFNTSFIVGPEGNVIHKHWKATYDPGRQEFCTTVHDVLDEFVERYGWDAVWPVARTDIGNIATFVCSEGFAPEPARAVAFRGAEIIVRSINGASYVYSEFPGIGDPRITMRSQCMVNNVYGIFVNNGLALNPGWYENTGGGSTMIIDDAGRILKQVDAPNETIISEILPIAILRRHHSIPVLRKELFDRVYREYEGKYPPNMYSEYLPKDTVDGITFARKKARW